MMARRNCPKPGLVLRYAVWGIVNVDPRFRLRAHAASLARRALQSDVALIDQVALSQLDLRALQ
jgi:hypothetical protein